MSPRTELRRILLHTLAIALLLALPAPAALAGAAALEVVQGTVEIGRGEPPAWHAAQSGDTLAAGERLRTGSDGRAELTFQGAHIRLYADSLLRLPESGSGPDAGAIRLEDGSSLFDVKRRESGSFDVHTPDVVVSVKGTRFGIGLQAGPAEVWVYQGTVGVRSLALADAREVMVREGFGAVGSARGPAELFLLDHGDPWNRWMREPAPRSLPASPPARQADDSAQRSVRRAARDRAIALSLERNPKLAKRFVETRGELLAAIEKQRDSTDRADSGDVVAAVDPLLDAATGDVEQILRSRFIEQVLNAPGNTLAVNLSDAGVIEIAESAAGQVWQLDQNELVAILEGTASLPAGLDSVIDASGVADEREVVTLLLGLLAR